MFWKVSFPLSWRCVYRESPYESVTKCWHISEKFKTFFSSSKKYIFFSNLRFFLGYSFDLKLYEFSIYDVFRAIPTLLHNFWERWKKNTVKNPPLLPFKKNFAIYRVLRNKCVYIGLVYINYRVARRRRKFLRCIYRVLLKILGVYIGFFEKNVYIL